MSEDTTSGSEESDVEEFPSKSKENDDKRCKYCVKLFKTLQEKEKHEEKCEAAIYNPIDIVSTKDGQNRFICNDCCRTFKFLTGLTKHKLKHEPPGGFICRICDAKFCSDFELQKHKEHTHMAYKCKVCKGKFTSKESYEEHIIKEHDGRDREYAVCEDCGALFKTRTHLSFHKQSNCGTSKPFNCDQCGSFFQNKWSLKNHKLIHNGEKKFCCSYCGNSFLNKGQLINHERKHTQEKPFVCEICSKAFAHRESLVTHSSTHTGIKPYLCEGCGACFSCIGNLIKHRRNRPFSCGLPQFTNKAKIAPRPSFKSGKFQTKTRIPKTGMVLADDAIKKMRNFFKREKTKTLKSPKKCTKQENLEQTDEKIKSDLNSMNEVNEEETFAITNYQEAEMNQSDFNEDNKKEPLMLFETEITDEVATTKTETICVLEIIDQDKIRNDDCNDFEDSFDDHDFTDFFDFDNVNEKLVNIEIKQETTDVNHDVVLQKTPDVMHDVKQEENCAINNENCSNKKRKNEKEEKIKSEDEEDDNIPLSKVKSKIITTKNKRKIPSKSSKNKNKNKKSLPDDNLQLSSVIDNQETNEHINNLEENPEKFLLIAHNSTERKRKTKEKTNTPSGQQTFECDHCPKIYMQRKPYVKHLVNDHKMNLYEIETSLDILNERDNTNQMRCRYCAKIYYQKVSLKRHEDLHGPEGTLIYKCQCCQRYFATPEEATEHAKEEHADLLKCNICNKIYSCPDSLVTHQKSVHSTTKTELDSSGFKNKPNNVCQKCGKRFVNKTALNDHERSNCGQNPLYQCNVCGRGYHSAGSLKTHRNIHTGELPYKCEHCDKACRTPGQLKVHQRKHTGEKPFKCEICEKAFAYRESLLIHMSLHTGVKRYICYGCGTRFSCISNLQNHRRTHKDTCGTLPLNSKASMPMGVARGILHVGKRFE